MTVELKQPTRPQPPIAVWAAYNDLIFCTVVPEETNGDILDKSIEYQCEKMFANLVTTLEDAGSSLTSVLHVTVYLTNIADRVPMTEAWLKTFEPRVPARATIGVAELAHPNMLIEASVVAAKDPKSS